MTDSRGLKKGVRTTPQPVRMRASDRRARVAIVGAGPSGLVLACALAQEDVDFIILDKAVRGSNTSRAAVVHARTLEVLEEIGVTDRLVAEGRVVPRFSVRDRDRVLSSVNFSGLPTRYPYTLMIPQCRTEAILLDRLEALGRDVEWSCDVTGITQDDTGCRIEARTADGTGVTFSADYVVGTDGMHSTVREAAGIAFDGGSYDAAFVLADVAMDWPLPDDEVELFFSPEGLVVVAPLPEGHHRVVATLDDAPEVPGLRDVQALLDHRGPEVDRARVRQVIWSSRFHVHHRVARRFVEGRMLLAGDSAHVHSPAGGQGMNTGIQDAMSLAEVLGEIFQPGCPRGRRNDLLDRYDATRRRIAKRVVAMTDRMTHAALLRSGPARRLRNLLIATIGSLPVVRRELAFELSELRNRERPARGKAARSVL